ncbi:Protein FAR1-RELATED SEQUENCE [Abeliophyllum distichum]
MLAHKSSLMVDDAALTDTRTSFLMEEFEKLHIRVKELDDGGNVDMGRSNSKSQEESQTIHDPSIVRAKGCGKRLKSSKEKALSKTNRQCSACGQIGHDKRTCPTLSYRSTMDMYQPEGTDYAQAQDQGIDDTAFVSNASSQCDVHHLSVTMAAETAAMEEAEAVAVEVVGVVVAVAVCGKYGSQG